MSTKIIKSEIFNLTKKIYLLKKDLHYYMKKEKLERIQEDLKRLSYRKDFEKIKSLNKECLILKNLLKEIEDLEIESKEIIDFLQILIEEKNEKLYLETRAEIDLLKNKIEKLELFHLFSGEYDRKDCYIDIQSGSGGTESQDWAKMLYRMYLKWAELHHFKTEIIEESTGEVTGIKSATIQINGNYAYGWLRTETGIHRLVRKSPFDSGGRRHTSFSSTFVYPKIDSEINVKINPEDLRIDVYRSSGAGGQHVNRTESAVRITHLPTNIVTQCQNNRSQHRNKEQAMKQLKSKIYKLQIQKKERKKKELEDSKQKISWGSQIRSYILDNSLVKDLRTGIEHSDVQSVLNGKLDIFIIASLKSGL